MTASPTILKFLKKNREAIDANDFNQIYKNMAEGGDGLFFPAYLTSSVTELFYEVGLDPLQYLDYVPKLFLYSSHIEAFRIPDHVNQISYGSFLNCQQLKNISMGSNILLIGESAFENCKSLTKVVLPPLVTTISRRTFRDCDSLQVLHMDKKLSTIEEDAFKNCESLKDIYFKGNLADFDYEINLIGNDAFFNAVFHCLDGDFRYKKITDKWVRQ